MAATEERKAFKDYFDRDTAKALGRQLKGAHSQFDSAKFVRQAVKNLDDLEMMARVSQFAAAMRAGLPNDLDEALGIIERSLPPILPDCEQVTDGYLQWPVGQFIADYGVEHFEASFSCMVALTQRFSSEFAIRPFVQRYPDEVFARLLKLTEHESPHVRRWCSEGVRTRLPWGKRLDELIANPAPIFPILEKLKDDSELYVRKSVANNLNDIAKDHPDRVVKLGARWLKKATAERKWVVRQALRTLVKAGHEGALEVLGFGAPEGVSAKLSVSEARVKIGDAVQLYLTLKNGAKRPQSFAVDYRVHYVKANGSASPKVFKWKEIELDAGEEIALKKKQAFKVTTIRPLYSGRHRIEVQVNGTVVAEAAVTLA